MDTKKLRQKILDLAIHGKLVPQDPNDEPASVLLERIRAEKETLIKEGKIKRAKKATASDTSHYENVPFEVPEGWCWIRLKDISSFRGGKTPSMENKEYWDNGTHLWVTSKDMKTSLISDSMMKISDEALKTMQVYQPGTLLMVTRSGILRRMLPLAILGEKATVNQDLKTISIVAPILPIYVFYAILANESMILRDYHKDGTTVDSINFDKFVEMSIPLPPHNEQKRIVDAIEHYLSLVEDIKHSEDDILVCIDSAKSKILDLAIHGKLVPQDPTDEPASELLKRINPKAVASCDNPHYKQVPFEIPSNWSWATLGDITNYGKCSTVPVDDIDEESWVLELEDIEKDSAKVIKLWTKSDRDIKGVRHSFSKGYVLYSKLRTYLNKVLVANKDGFCTTEIIPIKCSDSIYPEYLCHVLRSKYFLDYTAQCGYGVKMPRLSTTDARKALVPLPPYEEQIKISAKIKELYCSLDYIAETSA